MRSKSIKKIIRKLSRKIICVNDSRYIKFKNFSILIGIFIFIILSTVSDVGAATVGKTIISVPTDPLRNGLVGWWTFDGKNMISNVADSSGNGNHGKMSGFTSTSSAVTAGKVGQGLRFDGVDDKINFLGPALGSIYTVSMWIYPIPSSDSYGTLFVESNIKGIFYRGGIRKICFYNSSCSTSNTAIIENRWNHIVVSVNDTSVLFYLNGVADGTGANGISYTLTLIGDDSNSETFRGSIDDVRAYNRVLSATEIQQLYSQGSAKVASTVSRPAQTGLSSGLVGHWTFDGKNMISNVADSSGNGNNGMMSGFTSTSSAVTAGKVGQGLRFDGSNDYVNISDSASISPTSAVTISTWMRLNETQSSSLGIVTKGPDSADYDYMLYMSNNGTAFWFFMKNSAGTSDFTPQYSFDARDGKWHLYTATFDGDIMRLYIDTTLVSSKDTALTDVRNTAESLRLGQGWGNYIKGSLDDVQVYSRALSLTEIQQLYSQGSAKVASTMSRPAQTGLTSGLVGHWTFDGKNMISNVADSSGNGNNGLMSGFTSTSSAVTAGKVGQGLRFDGSNDYITSNQSTISNYPFSLSIWAKPASISSQQYAISYALNSSNVVFYAIGLNGDKAYIYSRSSTPEEGSATGAISLKNDKWIHIVGIFNSATDKRIYIDGVQHALLSTSIPFVSANTAGFGVLARSSQFGYWNGLLDDARVYNRALTDSEITQIYNAGK